MTIAGIVIITLNVIGIFFMIFMGFIDVKHWYARKDLVPVKKPIVKKAKEEDLDHMMHGLELEDLDNMDLSDFDDLSMDDFD